jgi:hypothetical protein
MRRSTAVALVGMLLATGLATPSGSSAATTTYSARVMSSARMLDLELGAAGRHHVLMRTIDSVGIAYATEVGGTWTTHPFLGEVGDISLGTDGNPVIALEGVPGDGPNGMVALATLVNGEWIIEPVVPGELNSRLRRVRVAVASDGVIHLAYSGRFGGPTMYRRRTAGVWSEAVTVDPAAAPSPAFLWDMVLDGNDIPHFVLSGRTPPTSPGSPCFVDAGCTVDIVPNGTGWTVTPISLRAGNVEAIHTADAGLEVALNDDFTIWYVGQVSGSWTTQSVVSVNAPGSSIARGPDGPVVFYAPAFANGGLRRADRVGSVWSNSLILAGNLADPVGGFDPLGRPHIGYGLNYQDPMGGEQSDAYVLAPDDAAPTVGVPDVRPKLKGTIGSTIPMTVSWTASDAQSGLDYFRLQQKVDAGRWSTTSTVTGKSTTRNFSVGPRYSYRVAGYDKAGNAAGWQTGLPSRVNRYAETSSVIEYAGTWTSSSSSTADGGTTKYTTSADAGATITFTGKAFGWVAPMSSTRGRAEIWIDGNYVEDVDTNNSTTAPRVIVYSVSWAASGPHTVEIRNLPTSTRQRIDIDAILIVP